MSSASDELEPRRPRWWAGLLLFVAVIAVEALLVLPLTRMMYSSGARPEQVVDSWWQFGYKLACVIVVSALVLVALRVGRKPIRQNLYFSSVSPWLVLLVMLMGIALGPWERLIAELVDPSWGDRGSGEPKPLSAPIVAVIVLRILLIPIKAELVFRGYILSAFRRVSVSLAVVVSALLFASIHSDFQSWLFLFHVPFGLLTALAVVRTGSVLPTIALHCTWNLLVGMECSALHMFEPDLAVLAISAIVLGVGIYLLFRFTAPGRVARRSPKTGQRDRGAIPPGGWPSHPVLVPAKHILTYAGIRSVDACRLLS